MPAAEFEQFSGSQRAYHAMGLPQSAEYICMAATHKVDNESAYRWLTAWVDNHKANSTPKVVDHSALSVSSNEHVRRVAVKKAADFKITTTGETAVSS